MAYRMFDTTTWSDPWFESLSVKAKLLFIYLWTNESCNQAGMYRLNPKIMEIQSGINNTALKELVGKVYYDPNERIVWVKNFFKRQCQNSKFAKAALKAIGALPDTFKAAFCAYNENILKTYGVTIPYRYSTDSVSILDPEFIPTDQFSTAQNSNPPYIHSPPPKSRKPKKEIFGKFENVKLTMDEFSKLKRQFGEMGAMQKIEDLSHYIGSKGDKYQSHYRTILNWARKNAK